MRQPGAVSEPLQTKHAGCLGSMDLDPGDSTAGAAAGAAPAGRLGSLGLDPGDSTAGAATHR